MSNEEKEKTITAHHINECNRVITLTAGPPDPESGASSVYRAQWLNRGQPDELVFHTGPVADGVNGITNEVLLAIVIDRLEGFQSGKFPCVQNENALSCLHNALSELSLRTALSDEARGTQQRDARGVVEGTR